MEERKKGCRMGEEVYADLYVLINASMDLLCLMITARLLHRGAARWRACLAALAGGGYALAALLLGVGGIAGVALDLMAGVLIVAAAFLGKGMKLSRFAGTAAVYLLVSALLGGIMTALFSFLNRLDLPLSALRGEQLSVWMFALLAGAASFLTLRGGKFFGRASGAKSFTVEAAVFGKRVRLFALVDSGNLLRDPVSGRSVIVADREKLRGVFPEALLREAGDPVRERWLSDYENAKKVRLIPAHTAGGETLLAAVIPESLTVADGKDTVPTDDLLAAAELGNRAAGFDALISRE